MVLNQCGFWVENRQGLGWGRVKAEKPILARAKAPRQGGRALCSGRNNSSKDAASCAGGENGKKGPRKGVKGSDTVRLVGYGTNAMSTFFFPYFQKFYGFKSHMVFNAF